MSSHLIIPMPLPVRKIQDIVESAMQSISEGSVVDILQEHTSLSTKNDKTYTSQDGSLSIVDDNDMRKFLRFLIYPQNTRESSYYGERLGDGGHLCSEARTILSMNNNASSVAILEAVHKETGGWLIPNDANEELYQYKPLVSEKFSREAIVDYKVERVESALDNLISNLAGELGLDKEMLKNAVIAPDSLREIAETCTPSDITSVVSHTPREPQ